MQAALRNGIPLGHIAVSNFFALLVQNTKLLELSVQTFSTIVLNGGCQLKQPWKHRQLIIQS